MSQVSLKKGLELHGERAEVGVHKELEQPHFCDSFEPAERSKLSEKELQKCLESHMLLKEKKSGEVEGGLVAGGNKQRDTITITERAPTDFSTQLIRRFHDARCLNPMRRPSDYGLDKASN